MKVKIIAVTKGQGEFEGKSAEDIIVYAARVSSPRKDKFEKPEGLIKYCIQNHHWSIFEQASITFEIVTSKAIGIQLLRHRSFTFQEFSQRYAEITAMEPVELRWQAEKNRQSSEDLIEDEHLKDLVDKSVYSSLAVYNALIENGIAKECARMVLPMCTQTTIYMTGSVRSWIHFLQIRDDEHAQKEVQLIAKEIKKKFSESLPIISKALGYV